ncbi:bidirectional sugar transporter SWEET15-like [Diospyros lotus]|uniref:bidirectional sugar transporter SWEET15-like n=1 Tax=Diospyros lotus TaxID=55363 RepID=UPI002259FBFF|nr:bidirectional sugar transporter SWEET15-like [Diospyros lotus]
MAMSGFQHSLLFTFGVLGNIISVFVYLAPLPTFIEIHRRKSTLGFQSLPYVCALFSAMLWMYYALLGSDAILLISINSFGCIIETIYLIIYLGYAPKKARNHTFKLLASLNAGVFSGILLLTLFLVKGSNRVLVVGWSCATISVGTFAAPLSIVFQVVRTRSVEFMPFTLSFFLTLSAVMWFVYGLLRKDLFVELPNVVGFFLGLLQMLLYGIYRNTKAVELRDEKLPENTINVVILANSEVHPIDGGNDKGVTKDEKEMHEATDHSQENIIVILASDESGEPNAQPVA